MSNYKFINSELVSLPNALSYSVITNHKKINELERQLEDYSTRFEYEYNNKETDPTGQHYRFSIISLRHRIKRIKADLIKANERYDKLIKKLDEFEELNKEEFGSSYQKIPPHDLYEMIISIQDNSIHYYNKAIQANLEYCFDEKKVLQKHSRLTKDINPPLYYELNKRLLVIQEMINKYIKIQTFIINYGHVPNKKEIDNMNDTI